jgi:hypothetical protein
MGGKPTLRFDPLGAHHILRQHRYTLVDSVAYENTQNPVSKLFISLERTPNSTLRRKTARKVELLRWLRKED